MFPALIFFARVAVIFSWRVHSLSVDIDSKSHGFTAAPESINFCLVPFLLMTLMLAPHVMIALKLSPSLTSLGQNMCTTAATNFIPQKSIHCANLLHPPGAENPHRESA